MMYFCKIPLPSLLLLTATMVDGFVANLLSKEKKLYAVKYQTLSSYCPPNPAVPKANAIFVEHKSENVEMQMTKDEPIVKSSGKTRRLTEVERRSLKLFEFRHHGQDELEDIMKNVSNTCSDVSRMYSIGKSFQGTDLWVMEFSMHPGTHKIGEPEIRYIGNVHGNEVTGRELLLLLIKYLCAGYLRNDPEILKILSSSRVHILSSMNPDGYKLASKYSRRRQWTYGRYNYHGKDLNRDFFDLNEIIEPFVQRQLYQDVLRIQSKKKNTAANVKSKSTSIHDGIWGYNAGCSTKYLNASTKVLQPETAAVVGWMHTIPFVLSGSFHDGGVGAIYPFDNRMSKKWMSETPDDKIMRYLASSYAHSHADMSDKTRANSDIWCRYYGKDFRSQGGVSNGADWFGITGSMEDYSYLATNTYGVTIELSCQKWISNSRLAMEWYKNKKALISYLKQASLGFKGIVRHQITKKPFAGAIVHVSGLLRDVTTTDDGEYWRLLLPGTYTVQARHGEMTSDVKIVTVTANNSPAVINFELF